MPILPPVDLDFVRRYGPWALVVGGSDGLGAAFVHQIAARGINCVIVARRQNVLDALAVDVRREHRVEVRTASIDLAADGAAAALAAAVAGIDLGLVVFNAGAEASGSTFLESPLEHWRAINRRNIDTLTEALHSFGSRLAAQRRGGIVIVGSIAALGGGARSGIYSATKGYALNLGESLWAELKPLGVDVLTLLFAIADTPTLRAVLARNGIPIEAANATPPAEIVRATLDAIADGPTLTFGVAADSPDTLTSPARRRERVNEVSAILEGFYSASED